MEGGSWVAMETVITIFPKEDDLVEEKGEETLGPDFAGKLFIIHVETTIVGVLESGPAGAEVSAEELTPS